MRADQLLVARGLASTRSQAQRLIADGVQWKKSGLAGEEWKRIVKNGDEVPEDAPIELLDDSEARYVSRGGLKLEAALKHVALPVDGLACLDVGQSTGGFTDCLLQHGARMVVGVDVGSAQLHPQLREDGRVLCVEKVNARNLDASDLEAALANYAGAGGQFDPENLDAEPFVPEFDLVVGDLSFISQTLVLPALVPFLKDGGTLLMLVKPQFELQPGQVGKGGIVKDAAYYPLIEARLREACAELDLTVTHWFDSPIEGGDGNREFFICARKPGAVVS
jgi:23S rRNA (cytidine1920-2'-O)/16S rRNA (cytidine1409-2'-O)-methyltransferase